MPNCCPSLRLHGRLQSQQTPRPLFPPLTALDTEAWTSTHGVPAVYQSTGFSAGGDCGTRVRAAWCSSCTSKSCPTTGRITPHREVLPPKEEASPGHPHLGLRPLPQSTLRASPASQTHAPAHMKQLLLSWLRDAGSSHRPGWSESRPQHQAAQRSPGLPWPHSGNAPRPGSPYCQQQAGPSPSRPARACPLVPSRPQPPSWPHPCFRLQPHFRALLCSTAI